MKDEIFSCDICKCKFRNRRSIENDISIYNREHTRTWGAVCDTCSRKTFDFVMGMMQESQKLSDEIQEVRQEVLVSN